VQNYNRSSIADNGALSLMHSLNHVLEVGTPYKIFESYISSYSKYIDFIKFGWGSALIDPDFNLKKQLCDRFNIKPLLGGTFFEYMILHHDFSCFVEKVNSFGLDCVELSRGTLDIDDSLYASYIRTLSHDFFVMSEIGRKSSDPSLALTSAQWVSHCELSADAGASLLILESRESGRSGYVSTDGDVNAVIIDSITNIIPVESLLFEAPIKSVQAFLIKRYGTLVNLGNLALPDLLSVQSLRLGLRSDTLLDVHVGL
jgi:phosphosulfolactate synthase